MDQLQYAMVTMVLAGGMCLLSKVVPGGEMVQLIACAILSVVVSGLAYFILFHKTNRYVYAQTKFYQILSRNM